MQQDARTAPDTDLEAYGDWVTVDATAPPASPTRRPPAAARDAEVAGELTGAEEEFLGRLSDADHIAATVPGPASAQGTGTPPDRAAAPGGVTSALDPSAPANPVPESAAGLRDAVGTPAASPASVAPTPASRGAERDAPADSGAAVEPELPSAPARSAQAAGPTESDGPMEPDMPEPREHPAQPVAGAHTDAPTEASEAPATWSENAGQQPMPVPRFSSSSTSRSDRVDSVPADVVAALTEQVASLTASVADVAEQVAQLQTRSKPSPAETVPAPGQVAVTLEELADDEPAIVVDSGVSADSATTTAHEDEGHDDGVPAMPAIRLEPIPESEHAGADPYEADRPELAHDDAAGDEPESDTFREDVRRVLACLDQLLDSLPPEKIREFAQSPEFATYKKLFTELGLDE